MVDTARTGRHRGAGLAPRARHADPGHARPRLDRGNGSAAHHRAPGRGEGREHHGGTEVTPGRVVENAAARYQVRSREAGRAVNGFGRETGFEVLAYAGDAENRGDPVGQPHVDTVPGVKGSQAEENGSSLVAVDMTFDN